MNQIIQKRRKALGMTQEQLAARAIAERKFQEAEVWLDALLEMTAAARASLAAVPEWAFLREVPAFRALMDQ